MARATIGAAILVCVVILALDVTAGILGLQAQIAQNKVLFQDIMKTNLGFHFSRFHKGIL
jgi:hypothetical protein